MPTDIENPVAVLYCPDIKNGRSMRVYGVSGFKYKFEFSKRYGQVVRQYNDVTVFRKEELDMRKNLRNLVTICTYVFSPEVAKAAEDSLEALIAEHDRIALHSKKACLEHMAARIASAISELNGISSHPEPPVIAPLAPVFHVEQKPEWMSLRDLMRSKIEPLRRIAAYYGVTNPIKDEMAREIFAKQGPPTPVTIERDPFAPDVSDDPLRTQSIERRREEERQAAEATA